jgi:protein-tyrosine phosphatase
MNRVDLAISANQQKQAIKIRKCYLARNALIILGIGLIAIACIVYSQQNNHKFFADIGSAEIIFFVGVLLLIIGSGIHIFRPKKDLSILIDESYRSLAYDRSRILRNDETGYQNFIMQPNGASASEIIPGVFIGDGWAGKMAVCGSGRPDPSSRYANPSITYLTKEKGVVADAKITKVISIGSTDHFDTSKIDTVTHIKCNKDAHKNYPAIFLQSIDRIADEINLALKNNEPILVHESVGLTHSVIAVAFFLVRDLNMTASQALGLIQSRRGVIEPFDSLIFCLNFWERHQRFPTEREFNR